MRRKAGSKADNGKSVSDIPEYSPRHPRFQGETKRVVAMLNRDAEERAHAAAVTSDRRAEALHNQEHPKDPYKPKVHERPAKRDRAMYQPRDPSAPRIKLEYRAVGPEEEHPLRKARRKLDPVEYEAGNAYRVIYESAFGRGRSDSTQSMMVDGGAASYDGVQAWTVEQRREQAKLQALHEKLGPGNADIVRKFCGERATMVSAVRTSVICHPDGVIMRVREALLALAHALGLISTPKTNRAA